MKSRTKGKWKVEYYWCDEKDFRNYQGQELKKGDVIKADLYFTEDVTQLRIAEIMRPYKYENTWYVYDYIAHEEVLVEKSMIEQIIIDKWYYRRRNPQIAMENKFYWEEFDTPQIVVALQLQQKSPPNRNENAPLECNEKNTTQIAMEKRKKKK